MNYPELEDIFLQFGLYTEKTPETKESNGVMNGYLDKLVKTDCRNRRQTAYVSKKKSLNWLQEPSASNRVFTWRYVFLSKVRRRQASALQFLPLITKA